MKPVFDRPFRVVATYVDQTGEMFSEDERYFVIAEVHATTAKRCAALLVEESPDDLAAVVSNALNLHAMPGLIARARL